MHPDLGSAGTASGPGASPELMWLSLAASTKAWAERCAGDDRAVTRARAARYMVEARAARRRADLRKGGAR